MNSSQQPNPFKLETQNKKFFMDLANKAILEDLPDGMADFQTRPGKSSLGTHSFETNNDKLSKTVNHGSTGNMLGSTADQPNRIRQMTKDLQALARQREEMLFKEAQMDYILKKQKPAVALGEFVTELGPKQEKRFRVRALLKEKKQSIHEFLEKKKEIYLSKMNINIKHEETKKLEDLIKDQEEELKARKLFFENDVEFMLKFVESIKKQADDAQQAVQNELKIQETFLSKLSALQAEAQKVNTLISKDIETLNNLKKYKQFINRFMDKDRNWKPYTRKVHSQVPSFLTENTSTTVQRPLEDPDLVILMEPHNLLQIFSNGEENNIREIQNLHDKQDELETLSKALAREQAELQKHVRENEDKLNELMRNEAKKLEETVRLKDMKRNNNRKITILDNENLDIDKVSAAIFDIFREISSKRAAEIQDSTEKSIKKAMAGIQHEMERLRTLIAHEKERNPHLASEIEKEIKVNQKRENILRKQEETKEAELRKQREQEKKRSEPHHQKPRGRKDLSKVIIQKKVVQKKEVNVRNIDDSEKYLTGDW